MKDLGFRKLSFLYRCKYAFEIALTYLAYGIFWLLPMELSSGIGGWFLSRLGPRLRLSRIARKNIDYAFPEKSTAEKAEILNGMWDNLGRLITEYPHLHRIGPKVEMIGLENFEKVRDSGKAAILFSGHFANWEIPAIRKRTGLGINIVYRKPNNPWVDGLLRYARSEGCISQIGKSASGTREIVSVLRKEGVIGLLVDQKLNEGLAIPFFGHDAMTAPAIAHFALKFGCPLYPFRVERLGGCRFRVTAFPALKVLNTGRKEEDVKQIMMDINQLLESWIRETPEQWLWIHRRWPKPLYSALQQKAAA